MAIIYHYCSPEAFLQIIERGVVWLSSTDNMNDYFDEKWVSQALTEVIRADANEDNQTLYQNIKKQFDINERPRYVLSLSSEKDSLSQWRAYGRDGEGVAIGFDEELLGLDSGYPEMTASEEKSVKLLTMEYLDSSSVTMKIRDVLKRATDDLKDGGKLNNVSTNAWRELEKMSMSIKNKAFIEEKEKRIIHAVMEVFCNKGNEVKHYFPIKDIKHRISSGYLTSYVEFNVTKESIVEIILGPKNKFTDRDIRRFLGLNDFFETKFERSEASYR